ncbi:hypothetical protein HC928_00550 [bacterium]|nr:hypothetical protein [bacterium]
MTRRRLLNETQRRRDVLKTTTVRDFSGGLNTIDNELTLTSKYLRELDNLVRKPDGSLGTRWGTRFLVDVNDYDNVTGDLADNPLTTGSASSQTVTVAWTSHPFISGHKVTFSGFVGLDGIPAGDFNKEHVVSYVDADSFEITVATACTMGAQIGGGTAGQFSYDNQNLGDDIVALIYVTFKDEEYYVVFGKNGHIIAVDVATLASIVIWDDSIAGMLSGGPTGWSNTELVSYTQFGADSEFTSTLIAVNGYDKPIEIDLTNEPSDTVGFVRYLATPVDNSNAYVPRAQFVTTLDNFLIMAGGYDYPALTDDPAPTFVWITAKGTRGCFPDQPAHATCDLALPSAAKIDVRRHISTGDVSIRGLSTFRNKLIVACERTTLIYNLGAVSSIDEHVPEIEDVINNYGTLSHRTIQSVGSDLLMLDTIGVPSFTRSQYIDTQKPLRRSALIDPLIQEVLNRSYKDGITPRTKTDIAHRVWSIYNPRESQFMLFLPNHIDVDGTDEYIGFIYTNNEELNAKSWSRFRGMTYACGTTTALGDLILCEDSKMYKYGSLVDPITSDKLDDPDIAEPTKGLPIAFVVEWPWADFDNRMALKHTRTLALDTLGYAAFTVQVLVDTLRTTIETRVLGNNPVATVNSSSVITITDTAHGKSAGDVVYIVGLDNVGGIDAELLNTKHKIHTVSTNSYKITVEGTASSTTTGGGEDGRCNFEVLDPAAEFSFVAGSSYGYGGTNPAYGGGVVTRNEKLVACPVRCKLLKMRISGSSLQEFQLISFSLSYLLGGIRL